jgi:hypothetical protein
VEKALRQAVRRILEAAVGSGQAAGQNLALLRKNNGGNVVYVLYDPSKLAAAMDEGDPGGVIYGYLDVKPHQGDAWNAAEVKYSAAEKGYGPLMYELAMSDFHALMPDRLSTSQAARAVWQKYASRADVEKKPFDDVSHPKTPTKADDAKLIPDYDGEIAYLNQAYAGDGDGGSKPTLMAHHKDAVATIADQLQASPDAVERKIMHMGDEYFGNRYRDG